jgi:hypothetical protein
MPSKAFSGRPSDTTSPPIFATTGRLHHYGMRNIMPVLRSQHTNRFWKKIDYQSKHSSDVCHNTEILLRQFSRIREVALTHEERNIRRKTDTLEIPHREQEPESEEESGICDANDGTIVVVNKYFVDSGDKSCGLTLADHPEQGINQMRHFLKRTQRPKGA